VTRKESNGRFGVSRFSEKKKEIRIGKREETPGFTAKKKKSKREIRGKKRGDYEV